MTSGHTSTHTRRGQLSQAELDRIEKQEERRAARMAARERIEAEQAKAHKEFREVRDKLNHIWHEYNALWQITEGADLGRLMAGGSKNPKEVMNASIDWEIRKYEHEHGSVIPPEKAAEIRKNWQEKLPEIGKDFGSMRVSPKGAKATGRLHKFLKTEGTKPVGKIHKFLTLLSYLPIIGGKSIILRSLGRIPYIGGIFKGIADWTEKLPFNISYYLSEPTAHTYYGILGYYDTPKDKTQRAANMQRLGELEAQLRELKADYKRLGGAVNAPEWHPPAAHH